MEYHYELIESDIGVPIKVCIHSVNQLKMHWHKHMEILLVLKGSINIRIKEEKYLLRENDLLLINSNEIHSTSRVDQDNIILVLQIDGYHYDRYFGGFSRRIFDCKSFKYARDEQEEFDIIRHYLAQLVWEINGKRRGHPFKIVSILNLLAEHLLNNFPNEESNVGESDAIKFDIDRISRILNYLDNNYDQGIRLQDLADEEELSIYYLSHYIKSALGISFQEYVNIRRLEKALDLLVSTDKSITEIAFESGFSTTKSLNNMLRNRYDLTPTEYREKQMSSPKKIYQLAASAEHLRSKSYFDVDREAALDKLFGYLEINPKKEVELAGGKREKITICLDSPIKKHNYYWKKLTTFGRAAEGLRMEWQNQLRELQEEIGFEYIRFHGIFSDEMMVYNLDDQGRVVYNWSYVNHLFDFFQEVKIKPFVELSFMPSEIRSTDDTMFWWRANISPPKDISLWTDLVKAFIKHCINRYGLKEVESWYFEVWNEPELEYVFWAGSKEEYFELYKETVLAIRSISENIKVGGPSITHQALKEGEWLDDFFNYCKDNNLPLDFLSMHIYPEDFSSDEMVGGNSSVPKDREEIMELFSSSSRIYYDEDHTRDTVKAINNKINEMLSYKPEVHITEWNVTSDCRNLINDTAFMATYIIRDILKSMGRVDSLGHWTFTDIMEEFKAGISHFHGGFGLFNKEGLKKPSYFAYYLLSKLGNEIIEEGEDYIVTRDGEDIQLLLYNFTYFGQLFLNGDTSLLTKKERYEIYQYKDGRNVDISIKNISGKYKLSRYSLNREEGSAFDEWIRLGAPDNMTSDEINYLKGVARPEMTVEYLNIDEEYSQTLHIPVHGVELIVLNRQI